MAIEDTILADAAHTPAPVFAYRAFRSIFFTSPDSSPVHGSDDKENTPFQSTPTKVSTSSRAVAIDTVDLKLTPLKRKRDNGRPILSPTKSCLRTPGVATPRTKQIREMNVKFKSISPELPVGLVKLAQPDVTLKTIPLLLTVAEAVKTNNQYADKDENNRPGKRNKTSTGKASAVISKDNVPIVHIDTLSASTASTQPEFDIEAYMERTEKEMKKLVKYSQKMREFARKSDEENARLRAVVEELQKENGRLRQPFGDGVKKDEYVAFSKAPLETQVTKSRSRPETIESRFQKLREDTPPIKPSIPPPPPNRDVPTRLVSRPSNSMISKPIATLKSKPPAPANDCISFDVSNHSKPLLGRNLTNSSQWTGREPEPIDHAMKSTSINMKPAPESGRVLSMPQAVSGDSKSASVAPDRLAAARERIRKKAELRKVSSLGIGSHMHMGPGDSSQVDWAAL